jgi:predicted HAD superfamily Cof-like phosphohydrolase
VNSAPSVNGTPAVAIGALTIMNPFNSSTASMSFDPLGDIEDFHVRFGLQQNNAIVPVGEERDHISPEEWDLRIRRLVDEVVETQVAHEENDDEEILDGLVDLMYIALGTAYRRGWDFAEAWKRVHVKNMLKERGAQHTSQYGSTYDIVKPEGWTPPSHTDLVTPP